MLCNNLVYKKLSSFVCYNLFLLIYCKLDKSTIALKDIYKIKKIVLSLMFGWSGMGVKR